jgi:hypothetical protein
MIIIFWDIVGVILVDEMARGKTINSDAYIKTMLKIKRTLPPSYHNIYKSYLLHRRLMVAYNSCLNTCANGIRGTERKCTRTIPVRPIHSGRPTT